MPATGLRIGTPASIKRHDAGTHASHRGGAIRFHDLAADADRVRKFAFRRNNRFNRPFSQRPMPNLASACTAESSRFSNAERRKIVMEDKALRLISACIAVDHLSLLGRGKRRECDCLRFAAREKRRTMRARQEPNFCAQRTKIMESAPVTALLPIKNADPECLFLQVIESLGNFERCRIWIGCQHRRLHFFAKGIDRFTAGNFSRSVKGPFDAVAGDLVSDFKKIIANIEKRDLTLRFAGHGNKFPLHFNNFPDVTDERIPAPR